VSISALNDAWFSAINAFAGKNPYLDAFMIFSAQVLIFIVPSVIIYLFFTGRRELAVMVFLSSFIAGAISMGIGAVYYHPRPFVLGLGTTLISHAPDSSFPSDHTSVAFAFAFSFLMFNRYRASAVFIPIASLIGIARIFCGVHFPLDIIGGVLVGVISAGIVFLMSDYIHKVLVRLNEWVKKFNRGGDAVS